MNPYNPINFASKFERLPEQWFPRVVAEMNDYQFKIVRIEGDFCLASPPRYGRSVQCSRRPSQDRLQRWRGRFERGRDVRRS